MSRFHRTDVRTKWKDFTRSHLGEVGGNTVFRMDASMSSDQEIPSGAEEHVEVEVSVFQIEREEPEDTIIRIRLGNRLRQRRRRQRLRAARSEAERVEPSQNECPLQVTATETEQRETHSEISQLNQGGQLESLPDSNNAESSTVEDTAGQLEENRETIDLHDFERILRRRESIRLSQRRRRDHLRNLSRNLESSDPLARCRVSVKLCEQWSKNFKSVIIQY